MTLSANFIQVLRTGFLLGVVACMTLSNPSEGRAQPPESVEALLAQVRSGDATWIGPFLRQTRGPRTPEALEALSDSLVAIIVAEQNTGSGLATSIMSGIHFSIAPERGVPFPQGVDLLFRIYDSMDGPSLRGELLFRLSLVAPPGRLLPLLSEAVESHGAHSITATRLLAEEMGPPGVAILQNAYCEGTIQNPAARSLLRGYLWSGVINEDCGAGAG